MRITQLATNTDWTFLVTANDGRIGQFDLRPYLQYEAFKELNDIAEFMKIKSADTSSSGNAALIFRQIPLRHACPL
jgi:hypothetical protein